MVLRREFEGLFGATAEQAATAGYFAGSVCRAQVIAAGWQVGTDVRADRLARLRRGCRCGSRRSIRLAGLVAVAVAVHRDVGERRKRCTGGA